MTTNKIKTCKSPFMSAVAALLAVELVCSVSAAEKPEPKAKASKVTLKAKKPILERGDTVEVDVFVGGKRELRMSMSPIPVDFKLSSSNPKVVRQSKLFGAGPLVAKNPGTARITYVHPKYGKLETVVTVLPAIELANRNAYPSENGERILLSGMEGTWVLSGNGSDEIAKNGTWKSSNPKVLAPKAGGPPGTFVARTQGTATVTFYHPDTGSGVKEVKVRNPSFSALTMNSFDQESAVLPSIPFFIEIKGVKFELSAHKWYTWSSSDERVLRPRKNGRPLLGRCGAATISVHFPNGVDYQRFFNVNGQSPEFRVSKEIKIKSTRCPRPNVLCVHEKERMRWLSPVK